MRRCRFALLRSTLCFVCRVDAPGHLRTLHARPLARPSSESVRRDPEYAWCKAELKKVLGLSDEFFNRSWAITDVHDSFTSMKVRAAAQERRAGQSVTEGAASRLAISQLRRIRPATSPSLLPSVQAHGKSVPVGLTDHLLSVVNRLATREFAGFVAPSIMDEDGKAVMRLSMVSSSALRRRSDGVPMAVVVAL